MKKNRKGNLHKADKRELLSKIKEGVFTHARPFRENLLARYLDEPYGDEQEGQSQYRDTGVRESVLATHAQLMDVLMSEDTLFTFTAIDKDDEQQAKLETAIIHNIMRGGNGSFNFMSSVLLGGLIEQVGYGHADYVKKQRITLEERHGIDYEDFEIFLSDFEKAAENDPEMYYEIESTDGLRKRKTGVDADGMPEYKFYPITGKDGKQMPIDVRIRCVKEKSEYEVQAVPQEEMYVSHDWSEVGLTGCPIVSRKQKLSAAALVAMGFHRDSVAKIGTANNNDTTGEIQRKYSENNDMHLNTDGKTEDVWVAESYVRLTDVDADGERIMQVWTDGDGSLILKMADGKDAVKEVDSIPFIAWTPMIVPNRHSGISMAELAARDQRLKTVLTRGMIDATTATFYPNIIVNTTGITADTLADLQNRKPNSIIRQTKEGSIEFRTTPDTHNKFLPFLEKVNQDQMRATGAQEHGAAIDFSALQKTQLGSQGVNTLLDKSDNRMKVILRSFAEYFLRALAIKMHNDFRRGSPEQMKMKINGEWVEYNPNDWTERTDLVVRVGSGRSDKMEKIERLTFALGKIQEGLAAGVPWINQQNLYNASQELMETMGIRNIEDYIQDPSKMTEEALQKASEPPPPNPTEQAQLTLAGAEEKKAGVADKEADNKANAKTLDHEFRMRELDSKESIKLIELEIKLLDAGVSAEEAAARIAKLQADADLADAKTIATLTGKAEKTPEKAK